MEDFNEPPHKKRNLPAPNEPIFNLNEDAGPSPRTGGDGRHGGMNTDPFENLPDVVMCEHLEKYLGNPRNKLNLRRASPFAAKLLEKSKAKWIFNELVQIPTFLHYCSSKELLGFRLVCRDWKMAMDNLWEVGNDLEHDHTNYKFINLSEIRSISAETSSFTFTPKLDSYDLVEEFLEEMKNHPGNPFVCGRASFRNDVFWDAEYEKAYWNQVVFLLEKFGGTLSSLKVGYRSGVTLASEMLRTAKELLKEVPQISTLELRFGQWEELPDDSEVVELELPPLPNLKCLTLSFSDSWDQSIPMGLALYFNQLVTLKVTGYKKFMNDYSPGVHSEFPRLQRLEAWLDSPAALFIKLRNMTSPLKEIRISTGGVLGNLSVYELFQAVEPFRNTLSVLRLSQMLDCMQEEDGGARFNWVKSPKIKLPKLKLLSLGMMECGWTPMDVLLKLSHQPEQLELQVQQCSCLGTRANARCFSYGTRTRGREERLPFHQNLRNMYQSNVWRLLPACKQIKVLWLSREGEWDEEEGQEGGRMIEERICFTREMYDYIRLRENNANVPLCPD